MIELWQIGLAGLLTGIAIWIVARRVDWSPRVAVTAAGLGLVLVIAWRLIANQLLLNDDFLPPISAADLGCLPIGVVGPAIVSLVVGPSRRRWLPAVAGGLAAFLVNVVVL